MLALGAMLSVHSRAHHARTRRVRARKTTLLLLMLGLLLPARPRLIVILGASLGPHETSHLACRIHGPTSTGHAKGVRP